MGRKKLVCIFLVCLVMIGSFCIPAGAVKNATQETSIVMRATGKFDVEVPADTIVKASSSFPLESGETVTVNASYSPRSADVEKVTYTVTYDGGDISSKKINSSGVPNGDYKVCIINAGSKSITGALQYEVK